MILNYRDWLSRLKQGPSQTNEALWSETTEAPTEAPPTTRPTAPPRPSRPGPRIRPGEREQERPMAALKGVIDLFFQELEKVKGTDEGKEMIKKLYSKYVTKD